MRTIKNKLIRAILVDDHPVVLYGISKLLEQDDSIEVCGVASNAEDAVKIISRQKPDVAVIDINLEGQTSGLDLVKAIKQRFPEVVSLILSMYDQNIYAERAMRAGAMGYVSKNKAPGTIISAIHTVAQGEIYLEKGLSDRIMQQLIHGKRTDDIYGINKLSDRELEIFRLIGQGLETVQIAGILNLSKNTIESHRRNIKEKLNITSKNNLVVLAAQWNIAEDGPAL